MTGRGRQGRGRSGQPRPGAGGRSLAVRLKPGKRRSGSSRRWLERQLNDPFVAEAKRAGYRSRAAFKLRQIDDRCRLLKSGARVVDLGAAPGGWSQVAAERCGQGGRVVAIDLTPLNPISGVTCLQGDIRDAAVPDRLRAALGGPANLVLSDMAAPATGHAGTDHLRIVGLVEAAFDFARSVLAPGGGFVAKVLQGGTEQGLLAELKRHFAQVRHVKPAASRQESAETYVVATGFRQPRAAKPSRDPDAPRDPTMS